MGLASLVAKAVGSAFTALGDIPKTCTYTRKSARSYDPSAGAVSASGDLTYTVSAVVSQEPVDTQRLSRSPIIGKDKPETRFRQVALIQQASLPFRPKAMDELLIAGLRYYVSDVGEDPAGATYKIGLQAVV